MFEIKKAWSYITPGGYLIVDDANWSAAFGNFCTLWYIKGEIINGQGFIKKST
jgi:hypothetical protein